MKPQIIKYLSYLVILLFLVNCKHHSPDPPKVYLDYPRTGASFVAGDTITFRVRVSADDEVIKKVLVFISDGNVKIFSDVTAFEVNTVSTTITGQKILPNYLETGSYFLTFKVETSTDSYKYFFDIHIQGLPLKVNVFAGANGETLYIFNDSLQFSSQLDFQDSILDIKPSSGEKAVYVLTSGATLYKYFYADNNLTIVDRNLNNSLNDFCGKMYFRKRGSIRELFYPRATGFNKITGHVIVQSQDFSSSKQRPVAILPSGNYVYVATKSVVGSEKSMLYVYYNYNLTVYKAFGLTYLFEPVSIVKKNGNLIRVYGNKSDTAMYFDVYVNEETTYQYYLSDVAGVNFAYGLSQYDDLVAAGNGLHVIDNNGIHKVDDNVFLSYANDSLLTSKFYLTRGTENIAIFSPVQEVVETQRNVGVSIDKFCLVYNK